MTATMALVAQTAPVQPEVERKETIASRAAAAKAAGKAAVSFPSRVVNYPVVQGGLTHSVSEFSVVVGTPRAVQTVVEDGSSIATWYSIDIVEIIANRPCKLCALLKAGDLPKALQPTSLLPIVPHSMLVLRRGGTVTVDGVKVSETENGVAALSIGERYLFVVDKAPDGMARLVLNDAGIFSIGSDGKTLAPISSASRTAGKQVKYPSLEELRTAANTAAKTNAPEPAKSNGRGDD